MQNKSETPGNVEDVAKPTSEAPLAATHGSTITTPANPDINLGVTGADRRLAYWITGETDDAKLTRSAQYIRAYVNQVVEHVLSNDKLTRAAVESSGRVGESEV